MENIDEDIEQIENIINVLDFKPKDNPKAVLELGRTAQDEWKQAIENLLSRLKTAESELETYKKIAEKLAGHIDDCCFCVGGDCIGKCKQHIIEWARKKVEDNV